MTKNFLNPERHQNPISGSIVTAILLKGWILPIGGASAVEGLRSTGLLRLVLMYFCIFFGKFLCIFGDILVNNMSILK